MKTAHDLVADAKTAIREVSLQEAEAAIQGLNGMSVGGRSIVVNLARPRESTGGYGAGARGGRSSY